MVPEKLKENFVLTFNLYILGVQIDYVLRKSNILMCYMNLTVMY